MRHRYLAFLTLLMALGACKKSSDNATVVVADKYMSNTAASTWQMRLTDNSTATVTNYTVTSTNRDSTINSKAYHVFTNSSTGVNEYFFISGNDYYTFRTLGLTLGSAQVETIYLKDNSPAGTTWNQTVNLTVPAIPFPVPVTLTYTLAEKGISRTVNGVAYTNVIHMTMAISSSIIPAANLTTDIQSYYAPKFGLIENTNKVNLNYSGFVQNTDTKTILLSADIK